MIVKIKSREHNEKVQEHLINKGYNVHTMPFRNGELYCYTYTNNFYHPYDLPTESELTNLFDDDFEIDFEIDLELKEQLIKHYANL